MFNPEQTKRLGQAIASDPALTMFEGRYIRTINVPVHDSSAMHRPAETPDVVRREFYPPDAVFGTPVVPSCMDGVVKRSFDLPRAKLHRLPDARLIGNTSIYSREGSLHAPYSLTKQSLDQFRFEVEAGHQAFWGVIEPEATRISFESRPTPKRYNLHALFLHNLEPANFGSFVFRQLPQLLYFRESGETVDCIISPVRTTWLTESLALLGLDHLPVFSLDETVGDEFASISFYNRFDGEGLFDDRTYELMQRFAVMACAGRTGTRRSAEKIYVSRALGALARPYYRQLLNEASVEAMAGKRGYAVVYPETMTFRQQIALFRRATHILSPSGSGLFNVAFCEKGVKLVDVETYNVSVRLRAKMYCSAHSRYCFAFVDPNPEFNLPIMRRSWEMPTEKIEQVLNWLEDKG